MRRAIGLAVVLGLAAAPAWAADRPVAVGTGSQPLFWPTNPVGVASELPRSPLADVIVNGSVRFSDPAEAKARCPDDTVVWVAFGSNHYRVVSPRDPGGWSGAYMCQADASIEGDRP